MRCAIAAVLVCLASGANAHDGHHDQWFKSLTNESGVSCCDGADFLRVEDPDWDVSGQHYRVRLEGKWIEVPPEAVVRRPNIVGFALVWPYYDEGAIKIRCFLAGSGA